MCTGTIAFVRGPSFAATSAGSMFPVSGSESTRTGSAPSRRTALAVAIIVNVGISTSSPSPTPAAPSAR